MFYGSYEEVFRAELLDEANPSVPLVRFDRIKLLKPFFAFFFSLVGLPPLIDPELKRFNVVS